MATPRDAPNPAAARSAGAQGQRATVARARAAPLAAAPWRPALAQRTRRLFLLKLVGTSALVGLFFIAYFALLRDPARPVFLMPLTALDHALPFQPAMLYAYLSLWLYVGTAPGLLLTLRELMVYALWAAGLALAGLAIFYRWPTAVPAQTLDVAHVAGFHLLQGVDAPGNACPSMHVAFAVLSFAWIGHILKFTRAPVLLRLANLVWVLAIVWSTLAIRQHVVLDVVAGAALGAAFAALSLGLRSGRLRLPRVRGLRLLRVGRVAVAPPVDPS